MYEKVSTEAKDILEKTKESDIYNTVGDKTKVAYQRASTFTNETSTKVKDKFEEIGVTQAV
jgi:hypothetical protein